MPWDEQEGIARLKQGDPEGIRFMVETYSERLFNAAFRLLRSKQDAEEVAQEALIKAYYSIASFREQANLYTWLYRIVFNLSMTRLNKRKKEGTLPIELSANSEELPQERPIVDVSLDPAVLYAQSEFGRILNQAISRLPDQQRLVFILKEIEGLMYEEIAEILNTSVELARTHLHRARLRLMQSLSPYVKAKEQA